MGLLSVKGYPALKVVLHSRSVRASYAETAVPRRTVLPNGYYFIITSDLGLLNMAEGGRRGLAGGVFVARGRRVGEGRKLF